VFFLDDLEDVTIGILKEEPGKGRLALGLDEGGTARSQPPLQPREPSARVSNGNVAAKFALETRWLELGIFHKMQFASWCDFEPGGCDADIARPRDPAPTEDILEEGR